MAKGFLIGIEADGNCRLHFQGSPYEMRQEFKRLVIESGEGYVEVLGYDDFSGPQPRKRRRFKGNGVTEVASLTETSADEFETEPEPYIGPEPEVEPEPELKPKKATKKRGKKKE
jgi:hypothetical protein